MGIVIYTGEGQLSSVYDSVLALFVRPSSVLSSFVNFTAALYSCTGAVFNTSTAVANEPLPAVSAIGSTTSHSPFPLISQTLSSPSILLLLLLLLLPMALCVSCFWIALSVRAGLLLTILHDDAPLSADQAAAIAAEFLSERRRRMAFASVSAIGPNSLSAVRRLDEVINLIRAWFVRVRVVPFENFDHLTLRHEAECDMRSKGVCVQRAAFLNLRYVVSGQLATTDDEKLWVESLIARGIALQWAERGFKGRFVGFEYACSHVAGKAVREDGDLDTSGTSELIWISTHAWPALVNRSIPFNDVLLELMETGKGIGDSCDFVTSVPGALNDRSPDAPISLSDISFELVETESTEDGFPLDERDLIAPLAESAENVGDLTDSALKVYDGEWANLNRVD